MLIKEFRIVMPFSMQEFHIGHLYSVGDASLKETGGGEGIEVVRNEPFDNYPLLGGRYSKGQYTYKIYHLASKVPAFIRMLAPKGSLIMHEEAWNAFPYCRTTVSNPEYMKENFFIHIETIHIPDDRGNLYNVHELSAEKLAEREVVMVDIAADPIKPDDYNPEEDPSKIKAVKLNRGPLVGNWRETCKPVMCCYKLVSAEFKWFGMQNRIENFILRMERRIFTNIHRQVYTLSDQWCELGMDDIRAIEDKVTDDLNKARTQGEVRGTKPDSDG